MTISYMFRAKSRPGLATPEDPAGTSPAAQFSEGPVAFTARPAVPEAMVVPPPVLLLQDRVPTPDPAPPVAAEPAARIVAPALPATGGSIAPYVSADARIIVVAKARGGIGATTLAVNLALELQQQANQRRSTVGGRVALLDLDVQLGNAGSLLDLADRGGMLALAQLGPEPDAQAVRHAMVRHASGLGVLSAPSTAMPFEAFDIRRVSSILQALAESHDIIIVDLPPALIDWLEPVLAQAERLLLVTDLAVPSVVRARRIMSLLTEDRPDLPVEIVVAHEKRPFRLGQSHRDAASALGHALLHWLPEETKLARQAQDRGEPLVQLAPRSGWSKVVKAMAAALLTQHNKNGAKAASQGDR